jgi:hypothetical protein
LPLSLPNAGGSGFFFLLSLLALFLFVSAKVRKFFDIRGIGLNFACWLSFSYWLV